jgi:hypothetical protein
MDAVSIGLEKQCYDALEDEVMTKGAFLKKSRISPTLGTRPSKEELIVLPTLRIKNAYNYTKIYATETIELPTLALYFVTCSFMFACVFLRLGYIF